MPSQFSIDLATLPPPTVVEQISFEVIVSAMIADLQARDPSFTALVESDPAFKIIEVCAYREVLLRQRCNEAARAVMLAYALSTDLDQIGAGFGVLRSGVAASISIGDASEGFILTALRGGITGNSISIAVNAPPAIGSPTPISIVVRSSQIIVTLAGNGVGLTLSTVSDLVNALNASSADLLVHASLVTDGAAVATAIPVTLLKGGIDENDGQFRARIQLALDGFSCAGPKGAYRFFALSVPGVADVSVQGANDDPTNIDPGEVVVTVLGSTGTGAIADPYPALAGETGESPILANVRALLNEETIRPLNDVVIVRGATVVDFAISATIYTYPGPDSSTVVAAAQAAVTAYAANSKKLGRSVTRAGIIAALFQAGAQNITLAAPAADVMVTQYQAANCTGITVTFGGVAS